MSLLKPKEERKKAETKSLAGEVAIVTGASSGIGAATAKELARRGATVVLAARRVDELEAQTNAITAAGHHAVAIPTDVTDIAQITRLTERTIELFGRIDVLVNNAGIAWREPYIENTTEQITQIVNVNLLSAIQLTHVVLPGMLERQHGSIIFVASVSAHIAMDSLYSATKFGLRGFSLSLRRELAGSGVSASLVSPGFVRTPLNRHMRLPMPGPELVARAIADLAVHPRREVIVPGFYRPLIEFERLFPWIADQIIHWSYRRVVPPIKADSPSLLARRKR